MLPARHRLRRPVEFAATVKGRGAVRCGGRLLVVHGTWRESTADSRTPRVGFVVSKAVGGAVVRNRTKRRLRALVAQRLNGIPEGMDLVVRANAAAAQASFDDLGSALDVSLAKTIGRLTTSGSTR